MVERMCGAECRQLGLHAWLSVCVEQNVVSWAYMHG